MSKNQRLALVAAVVVVAAIAFVVARSGSDDGEGAGEANRAVETAPTRTSTTPEETPTEPTVERIAIRDAQVEGGARTIRVKAGDRVRIVISADAPDQLHLHGYDIEREARPGAPARFDLTARLEGVFDLESHTAEDAGLEPVVAKLVVEPS
jgi:FtsP/CotA-like multicopper oxidase with cupredoxin domain